MLQACSSHLSTDLVNSDEGGALWPLQVDGVADNRMLVYKRLLDIVLCPLIMLGLLPFVAIVAVLQIATLRSFSIFYAQSRIGFGGRAFPCFKFRTMMPNADRLLADLLDRDPAARAEWEATHKLRNDPRVTSLGRTLRALSIDELPQLWNVLRGDMSLVGPRPVTEAELTRWYKPAGADQAYISVRPGMTGLWQVSGRIKTTYQERVALDQRYVQELSLSRDAKILMHTVRVVLFAEGAC